MKVAILEISCDIPDCTIRFRAQFVSTAESMRHESHAKREGWRQVRAGMQMIWVCPGHPEVI